MTSGKTYGYSSENLLTSASGGVSLAYDPAMRLSSVASAAATTGFAYDGPDAIAEYDGAGALQRRYVFDPTTGQPVIWYEGSGVLPANRRYLSQDERGSVISISDSNGANLGINTYDEYGRPGATNLGLYQYTGQKWLGTAGLYDYKARDYFPHLGIFAQADPIGPVDDPNLYVYALDDPINLIDPFGLRLCAAGIADASNHYLPGEGAFGPCPGMGASGAVGGAGPADLRVRFATRAQRDPMRLPQIKPLWKRIVCSIGNLDFGLGADGYAGLGASVGGSIKLDLTTGQTGFDGYTAVGLGLGIETGPTITSSASGNPIITANLITQVGGGYGVGVVATRTLIGTSPRQNSLTVGKLGSPIGFVNAGAAIGFHTPALWDLGC